VITATSAPTALPAPVALNRETLASAEGRDIPVPPVRIVHLGLGAFARAHQAWYTATVDDTNEWGIAAFTGRSATAAEELAPQNGLYSLIERSAEGDTASVVTSLVEAWDGARIDRLVQLIGAPTTAIVTLTITESGYRLNPDGSPALDDPAVSADVELLRSLFAEDATMGGKDGPRTALGRLLLGLETRRRGDVGPLAVVPCDNMPDNGPYVRAGLLGLAATTSDRLAEWIDQNVSFVSTSVDRITPKTTASDIAAVTALTGWADAAPVVTEPFHDWILSGAFPAGRPDWERAGARFVEDIEPFERRKLWILNGAHSLLAYAGLLRGHETVAQAISDPACRSEVLELWAESMRHLPATGLDLDDYAQALLKRFENARIEHRLEQISGEGLTKIRVRFVPVALAEREEGRGADACAAAIGAWVAFLRSGRPFVDAHSAALEEALQGALDDPARALLQLVEPQLAADELFLDSVRAAARRFR
jgi:fructuronate reductase